MTVEEFAPYRTARLADGGQFDSIFALMLEALRIYARHYFTFFAIYALAVLPTSSVVLVLEANGKKGSWAIFLTLVTGLLALSAVAVATSDAAVGNRPSILRSYRRTMGRRGVALLVNCVVSCLVITLPLLLGWGVAYGGLTLLQIPRVRELLGVATEGGGAADMVVPFILGASAPAILMNTVMLALLLMYVPVISALEMRVTSWRAIRRSISLGRHHRMRGVAIIAAGLIALLLVDSLVNVLLVGGYRPSARTASALGVAVNLIVTPAAFIAVILLYFDLRSRKEGYGFAELAEDIY